LKLVEEIIAGKITDKNDKWEIGILLDKSALSRLYFIEEK